MDRAEIEDIVSDILLNDGPDMHIDGYDVITDFIISLLSNNGEEWATKYYERIKKHNALTQRTRPMDPARKSAASPGPLECLVMLQVVEELETLPLGFVPDGFGEQLYVSARIGAKSNKISSLVLTGDDGGIVREICFCDIDRIKKIMVGMGAA